jgi:hypothetical protein
MSISSKAGVQKLAIKPVETETESDFLLDYKLNPAEEEHTKTYQKIWEKRLADYESFFEKKKAKKTKRK